jgi:polar amino acid transport system substrate-binding protein
MRFPVLLSTFLFLILMAFLPCVVSAGSSPAPAERTLSVGTKIAPPFAFKDEDGSWKGITIELWEEILNTYLGVK